MGLLRLLPLLALCHGAALPEADTMDIDTVMDLFQEFVANPEPYMEALGVRAKRHTETEDHSGFKRFPIPFVGAEFGVKYADPSDRVKGGEAFVHVKDLQSLIPAAHSKMVKVHMKFDGGASSHDGLFTADVDYHLQHKDGHGTEEGSLKVQREMRAGKWHTLIKTESHPFTGTTIIPQKISNLELELESDRKTTLTGKYINAFMARDITWDIVRVPGKSIKAVITRGGVTSTINAKLNRPTPDAVRINIDANIRGTAYTGEISGKMPSGKPTELKVDIKRGSESMVQMSVQVKMAGRNGKLRGKYSVMGGKAGQGKFTAEYKDGKLVLEGGPYKLEVELTLGRSIKVTATKGAETMWTYETLRQDKSTADEIIWEAESKMTLNPASKVGDFINRNYAFGNFQTRTNNFKLRIAKHDRNLLFRKFELHFDVVKDSNKVIHIAADTFSKPYSFSVMAPNLFKKLHINQNEVTLTINHQRPDTGCPCTLTIESNIAGGLKLDAKQQPNGQGGRDINILATQAGAEMWKYHGVTSKINNAAMLKVGLKGQFNLNPESILYKNIVSKYRILTPFAVRKSDLEFFWDKQSKNALMNKFYGKVKIDKDGTNVMNLEINTNKTPYKLHLFMPALLGKLRPGMTEVDVDVEHHLGQSLEMRVNHAGAKFKGFKIHKTGSGSEREIEWNGKKLGKGDYTMTDKMFKTTQTLASGKHLTTTINWKNKWDTTKFLLDNQVHVNLDGSERTLDLNLDWGMSKIPDMDLSTPESFHLKINGVGNNKRWGDYKIIRDIAFASGGRQLSLDVTGDSSFSNGALAAASPIKTLVKLNLEVDKMDLNGKVMKVMAGKEYSILFHRGFTMPSIKIGA
jgi:hypothetical protein